MSALLGHVVQDQEGTFARGVLGIRTAQASPGSGNDDCFIHKNAHADSLSWRSSLYRSVGLLLGSPARDWQGRDRVGRHGMKKLLELLVCFLHPLAVILMWIDLAGRNDLSGGQKLAWGLFGLIPLVPFVYVLTGGDLW